MLSGPTSPYATDNRNPFSRGHSPPSHANVTNKWSYSFNPPYDTHIVSRDVMCKLQERILQVMYTKKSFSTLMKLYANGATAGSMNV